MNTVLLQDCGFLINLSMLEALALIVNGQWAAKLNLDVTLVR
jgi:hypothetical protein